MLVGELDYLLAKLKAASWVVDWVDRMGDDMVDQLVAQSAVRMAG